jgi:hypothetical protein
MSILSDVVNSMQNAFEHSSQTGTPYPTRSMWLEEIGNILTSSGHPASSGKDPAYLSELISNIFDTANDRNF